LRTQTVHAGHHPHQNAARQRELVAEQHPHAAILSCADSRVAPEIVFDQGLGDLFDVRVAGNIAGDAELASLEYAVEHVHTPLPSVVAMIRPAVERARRQPGDLIENAVRLNVENVVSQIRASKPLLADVIARGELKVVGAVYSLDSGKVAWLPDQSSAAPPSAGDACPR